MNINLRREIFTSESTIGSLYVDGVFQCYTLEDVVRPAGATKVYGKTAIPYGTYKIELRHSPKYGRVVPWIKDVPGFEWILIHWGNWAKDTDGCILVGNGRQKDMITASKAAFNNLFPIIEAACKKGEVTLTIEKSNE